MPEKEDRGLRMVASICQLCHCEGCNLEGYRVQEGLLLGKESTVMIELLVVSSILNEKQQDSFEFSNFVDLHILFEALTRVVKISSI